MKIAPHRTASLVTDRGRHARTTSFTRKRCATTACASSAGNARIPLHNGFSSAQNPPVAET